MSIGTKRTSVICTVCGAEVKGPFHGRIPEYCSKECREFRKYLNAAARALMAIQFDAEHLSKLRSELFTLSNQVKGRPAQIVTKLCEAQARGAAPRSRSL